MSDILEIHAERRADNKNPRLIRKDGKIPDIVYGEKKKSTLDCT